MASDTHHGLTHRRRRPSARSRSGGLPSGEQPPRERARNFCEVSAGYTQDEALLEAERCLICPDQPCVAGCPVNINIPGFIRQIAQRKFRQAYDVILGVQSPAGRVRSRLPAGIPVRRCLHGGADLEPVAIGRLERWVGDAAIRDGWINRPDIDPTPFRVGIVGSGPAGMACCRRHGQGGMRRDGVRSLSRARRRPAVRHSRFPVAE